MNVLKKRLCAVYFKMNGFASAALNGRPCVGLKRCTFSTHEEKVRTCLKDIRSCLRPDYADDKMPETKAPPMRLKNFRNLLTKQFSDLWALATAL